MRARWLGLGLLLTVLAFGFGPRVSAAGEPVVFDYAPKLSLRFDGGVMQNVGTLGGTGGFAWGANLLALYYPDPAVGLGAGYRSTVDLIKGTVPVSGLFLVGRWYFIGEGTRVLNDAHRMEMERHGNFAFYTGLEFAQSGYYLGENAKVITDEVTGSYFGLNGVLGTDVRLSDHFEVNVEGNMGLLILASTDERFRIKGTLMSVGVSYIW